jgi:hypothetical protein
MIGALEALLALQQPAQALDLANAGEKLGQSLPDYWYLRGMIPGQDASEITAAFERCLSLRGQPPPAGLASFVRWVPERAARLPLQQLAATYRSQMHDPAREPHRRWQLAQQLLTVLQQLLQLGFEQPVWYLWLAEAALVSARMHRSGTPGPSPLTLYRQFLPEGFDQRHWAFAAETALIYLEGRTESLMDRLPADYSYETIRELQLRPYNLHAFCQQLWQRSEVDGPDLVKALLTVAAQAHQDLSLWLLLSHLYAGSGEPEAALRVLEDAQLQMPANPYLLCQLGRLQLQAGDLSLAQQSVNQALTLRPDLEEALHLHHQLTASKRRRRFTEHAAAAGARKGKADVSG